MKQSLEKHIENLENLIGNMQLEEALDYIENLSQEETGCWQIQNLTGVICSYCGQFPEAIAFFRRALSKNPDEAEIYFNLADAYFNIGEYQHAELMLKSCEQVAQDTELLNLIKQMRMQFEAEGLNTVEDTKDNQLLMVAYYFPPLSGSGVFRSIKHAKYLPELNWNTTVISTNKPPRSWNYRDDSMVDEIPKCVDVIRVDDDVNTKKADFLSERKLREVINFLVDVFSEDRSALEIINAYLKKAEDLSALVVFPCSCLCWAWDVIKYIEANMDIRRYSVIYTTSGPASAHLIGYYMKKKYGIPWIADYRDAWTNNPYSNFDINIPINRLLYYLEKKLLHAADCNITIEQSMVQDYVDKFGISKEKIVCITNGYDEEDFTTLNYNMEKTKKFTINYSGLLYLQQQSIMPVLNAINQLNKEGKIDLEKIKLRIVGQGHEDENKSLAEKFGLLDIVEQTGYVSHREALQANLDSDILLLLIGDAEKCKPVYAGKVFEYLRSGKPILALAPHDGAVDKLLSSTGHGQTFLSTQEDEIKNMILQEYQKWEGKEKNEYISSPLIKRYERKYLAMKLADLLYLTDGTNERCSACDSKDKYLVVCTGGYPDNNGGHANMFAHKRVLEYVKKGLDIDVFGFVWRDTEYSYIYEGINVVCGGGKQLEKILREGNYRKLLIHFADISVFSAIINAGKMHMPMIVWCHGYEVLSWSRSIFEYTEEQIKNNIERFNEQDKNKKYFLRQIFECSNIHFIFVSKWLENRVKKFVGSVPKTYEVIHNYIDTDFYCFSEKKIDDKMNVLCIKNHRSKIYANDLTAKAILELSHREVFKNLEFELYGKGQLFESNFKELIDKNFPNVYIYQKSLTAQEMRECYKRSHILLSPTRLDSQGVTSGEGMSAGLCVISCNTTAVPEFMDESCASLVEYDNYMQIVEEIEYLYYHREECARKARNAHERVKKQCGYDATIKKEIMRILA